jgi:hypothetical protein
MDGSVPPRSKGARSANTHNLLFRSPTTTTINTLRMSQRSNSLYRFRFTGISRTSFRIKFFRSKPLSRAHLLMPISLILFLTSSLASTFPVLPYSVALNPKTLGSSLSSHFRSGFLTHVTDLSRDHMRTPKESYCFRLASRAIGCEALGFWMNADIAIEGVRIATGCLLCATLVCIVHGEAISLLGPWRFYAAAT